MDRSISPQGSAIPTVLVGLDRVDPSGDPSREAIGETASFNRFSVQLAYRSPVASMSGGSLFLEAGLRHYRQLDASAAVIGADLASFTEASIALVAPNGLYVAYSGGRLPFDELSTGVYQAGFRYSFGPAGS
jgi:hypothetical protein